MRAFITGAGGGIGGAIKELYLHSGYEVVAPPQYGTGLVGYVGDTRLVFVAPVRI